VTERMLIIDDEELVLESCRKIFTAEGFEVVTTAIPQEGLKLASGTTFDIILCDWKMPGFNGMDVVEELDRLTPESTVVMISGYPSVGRATEAMKRGAMDYLAKPFTPEEILETVKRAMQRKLTQERKVISRFEQIARGFQFPVPDLEDKAPKTIAETVASTISVGKTTSPWVTVFVLGILAGAYIGFGGLLSTTVTYDMASKMGVGFTKFMGGAVLGIVLGWLVSRLASAVARTIMERQGVEGIDFFATPPWLIGTAFLFGLAVSLLSGSLPSSRAARVDPVKALRNE